MIVSDQRPPGEDWLVRRIVDLERQVRELQAGRRLEAATIGAGGLTVNGGSIRVLDGAGGSVELAGGALRVLDTAGNVILELGKMVDGRYGWRVNNAAGEPQIRAGQLAGAGGYGLEAVDEDGELADLGRFLFAITSAFVQADGSFTGEQVTPTDLPGSFGPQLTVTVGSSGRLLVIGSAKIDSSNGTLAQMFAQIGSDPVTFNHLMATSALVQAATNDLTIGSAAVREFSGLTPGPVTITAKYVAEFAGVGVQTFFSARALVAIPL